MEDLKEIMNEILEELRDINTKLDNMSSVNTLDDISSQIESVNEAIGETIGSAVNELKGTLDCDITDVVNAVDNIESKID